MNWYKLSQSYNSSSYAGWIAPDGSAWSGSSHSSFFATTDTHLETTQQALAEGWVRVTNMHFNRINQQYNLGFELPQGISSKQKSLIVKMIQDASKTSDQDERSMGVVVYIDLVGQSRTNRSMNIRDAVLYIQNYPQNSKNFSFTNDIGSVSSMKEMNINKL